MSVQLFRLWPRRPLDGSLPLGLSCDDEGLLLAGNRGPGKAIDRGYKNVRHEWNQRLSQSPE
jgi:hypothetical protein